MTQYALPTSDGSKSAAWLEGAGDGDANWFDELDEGFGTGRGSGSGPDDLTTYWYTSSVPVGSPKSISCGLGAVTDPGVHTGHIVRSRNRKNAVADVLDITIGLYQGVTLIAEYTWNDVSSTITTREFTLTEVQAAAITDYSALVIQHTATKISGTGTLRSLESAFELEVPDVLTGHQAQVSWAEMEVPLAPRRTQVSWGELEVPLGPRRAQISWSELEVPLGSRRGQVSWGEFEIPIPPRRVQFSWGEVEVPLAPRRTQFSWAEIEMPLAPRRGLVSWSEFEIPAAPRQAQVAWAEMEVPVFDRIAQVSWAVLEVPSIGGGQRDYYLYMGQYAHGRAAQQRRRFWR